MIETTILGIVGNYMYIAPFYAGDNDHHFYISNFQKSDLLERNVKEYPSYQHIEALLYNLTYEEYLDMLNQWEQEKNISEKSQEIDLATLADQQEESKYQQ
jgi:hypothetical protein